MAKRQAPLTFDDKEFNRALEKVSQEMRTGAGRRAVERAGNSIMKASIKRTPVEFGDVRDSHSLRVETAGDVVIGTINVSDPAAFFAHYDYEASHDDGRSLFLTSSMKARKGFYQKTIREEFSDAIRAAGLGE